MRDYAKLAPTFWTGETGKALRRRGFEGVVSALYLISSPHSNMLGLFYQPIAYMGHETGLGEEGARKGLQHCIDVGLCSYDAQTEMVFVHEMAAWQIGDALSSGDKRCKGIQKDYDALPNCPFLEAWFERYGEAFNLTRKRQNPKHDAASGEGASQGACQGGHQAPSKPGTGTGAGAPSEHSVAYATAPAPPTPSASPPALPPEALEPQPAMTAKERVWAIGVSVIGDKPADRKRIGKLAGTYGDELLAEVLAEAAIDRPAEAMSWVTAACEARRIARPKAINGHAQQSLDMTAGDPKPAWAIAAGFANRFEAENEGCTERNAHRFSNGRRKP